MKKQIIKLGQWGQKHWLSLIIIMSVVMMIFLCLVLISWLIGYWANALYGMRFELSSCWSGITAVVGGIATIVGLAKACWTKYGLDSKYNSAPNKMPAPIIQNAVNSVVSKVKE